MLTLVLFYRIPHTMLLEYEEDAKKRELAATEVHSISLQNASSIHIRQALLEPQRAGQGYHQGGLRHIEMRVNPSSFLENQVQLCRTGTWARPWDLDS